MLHSPAYPPGECVAMCHIDEARYMHQEWLLWTGYCAMWTWHLPWYTMHATHHTVWRTVLSSYSGHAAEVWKEFGNDRVRSLVPKMGQLHFGINSYCHKESFLMSNLLDSRDHKVQGSNSVSKYFNHEEDHNILSIFHPVFASWYWENCPNLWKSQLRSPHFICLQIVQTIHMFYSRNQGP